MSVNVTAVRAFGITMLDDDDILDMFEENRKAVAIELSNEYDMDIESYCDDNNISIEGLEFFSLNSDGDDITVISAKESVTSHDALSYGDILFKSMSHDHTDELEGTLKDFFESVGILSTIQPEWLYFTTVSY